ncbi:hypothetical protein NQZ68_034247 [Dissostichus eleginoides]|nr:hypothetical protein NQZ68_034247 [Dissostichus eleginoides]
MTSPPSRAGRVLHNNAASQSVTLQGRKRKESTKRDKGKTNDSDFIYMTGGGVFISRDRKTQKKMETC